MGIYIRLASPTRISLLARALSRIKYCYESIRYFHQGRIFLPETIKIWLNAPTETLGGILKRQMKIVNLYRDVETLRSWVRQEFYRQELFSSIIVFEGIWDFDDIKLAGFFSANNEYTWREAYLDVEMDAYGKGEFEDLVDVFWKKGEIETIVSSFVTELKRVGRGQPIKPREIYFSIGAPEHGEVANLRALHLQDWRAFVGFLYSRLRRDKASWIKNKVAPIDRGFFLSSIREQKVVQTISKKILEESLLTEKVGKSVTYIARDRDSFTKFYQKFKEEVFKSASQDLPEADALKKRMQKGLERTETLG